MSSYYDVLPRFLFLRRRLSITEKWITFSFFYLGSVMPYVFYVTAMPYSHIYLIFVEILTYTICLFSITFYTWIQTCRLYSLTIYGYVTSVFKFDFSLTNLLIEDNGYASTYELLSNPTLNNCYPLVIIDHLTIWNFTFSLQYLLVLNGTISSSIFA